MPKSPKRIQQIADVIRHTMAGLLKKSVRDPRLHTLSITGVDLSPDLGNAKIYYTILEVKDKVAVAGALKKATGYLRHQLSQNTEFRYTPKISFVYDESVARGQHLSELINSVTPPEDDDSEES